MNWGISLTPTGITGWSSSPPPLWGNTLMSHIIRMRDKQANGTFLLRDHCVGDGIYSYLNKVKACPGNQITSCCTLAPLGLLFNVIILVGHWCPQKVQFGLNLFFQVHIAAYINGKSLPGGRRLVVRHLDLIQWQPVYFIPSSLSASSRSAPSPADDRKAGACFSKWGHGHN